MTTLQEAMQLLREARLRLSEMDPLARRVDAALGVHTERDCCELLGEHRTSEYAWSVLRGMDE